MSQHIYCPASTTGQDIEVLMGFEPILNRYFLDVLVYPPDQNREPESDTVYERSQAATAGFPLFKDKLAAQGLHVPETVFQELVKDGSAALGNRVVKYNADGSVESEWAPSQRP